MAFQSISGFGIFLEFQVFIYYIRYNSDTNFCSALKMPNDFGTYDLFWSDLFSYLWE